jgi:hypothetical protein
MDFKTGEQLKGSASLERIPADVATVNTAQLRYKCSSVLAEISRYQMIVRDFSNQVS